MFVRPNEAACFRFKRYLYTWGLKKSPQNNTSRNKHSRLFRDVSPTKRAVQKML